MLKQELDSYRARTNLGQMFNFHQDYPRGESRAVVNL